MVHEASSNSVINATPGPLLTSEHSVKSLSRRRWLEVPKSYTDSGNWRLPAPVVERPTPYPFSSSSFCRNHRREDGTRRRHQEPKEKDYEMSRNLKGHPHWGVEARRIVGEEDELREKRAGHLHKLPPLLLSCP